METPRLRIRSTDLDIPPLPDPGYHLACVHSVRSRPSASGNDTIQVTFRLLETDVECDCVTDYFVIGGASARAIFISRRRLMDLLRACGEQSREDQEISLSDLKGRQVDVRVAHETYDGATRACVTGYWERP